MNDCYKLLSNLKCSDILETMIDAKNLTVCGTDTFANAFNEFFVSVLNASGETLNDFTDNEINEMDVTVETVRDALKSSGNGIGPDLIPGQILRDCSNSPSIVSYNIVSFIMQSGDNPSSWKRTIKTPIINDGGKAEITNYRPIAYLSKLPLAFESIVYRTILKNTQN